MQVFIADIRNCQNKEQEKIRVDKELGKIRKKFASGNALTGILTASLTSAGFKVAFQGFLDVTDKYVCNRV